MDRFKNWKRPVIKHNILTKWHWLVLHPENLILGDKTDIGAFCLLQAEAGIEIQDNVQVGSHTAIYSVNTIDGTRGKVIIEVGARVGSHCVIMPAIVIGQNSIIGAHSFVTCDVPPNETWYGTPAKRKREHVQSKGQELRSCRGLWADRESDCSRAPSVRG